MPNPLLDALYRYGEPAAGLLSGAVAEPISGWAGLLSGNPSNVEAARNALTYQPRTMQGQQGSNALAGLLTSARQTMVDNNPPVRMAVDGYNSLADMAGSYSPALGAAVRTAPVALSLLAPGKNAFSAVGRDAMENAGATGIRGPLAGQDGMVGFKAEPSDPLRYHSEQVRQSVKRQLDAKAIETLKQYGSPDDAPLEVIMRLLKQR